MTDTNQTKTTPGPEVAVLTLAEEPAAWAAAGFTVDDDGTCRLGHITVELAGRDRGDGGLAGWSLRGLPDGAPDDLDGFATRATDRGRAEPFEHPNSAVAVDHIVLLTDDLKRTGEAAAALGLIPRRWRDHRMPDGTEARQVFVRAGQVVLEIVAPRATPPEPRPGVRPFGLAVTALDIEKARSILGEDLGPARRAVQPGRFIATVRRGAHGLTTPLALMSPPPPRPAQPPAEAPEAGSAPTAPDDDTEAEASGPFAIPE